MILEHVRVSSSPVPPRGKACARCVAVRWLEGNRWLFLSAHGHEYKNGIIHASAKAFLRGENDIMKVADMGQPQFFFRAAV